MKNDAIDKWIIAIDLSELPKSGVFFLPASAGHLPWEASPVMGGGVSLVVWASPVLGVSPVVGASPIVGVIPYNGGNPLLGGIVG